MISESLGRIGAGSLINFSKKKSKVWKENTEIEERASSLKMPNNKQYRAENIQHQHIRAIS